MMSTLEPVRERWRQGQDGRLTGSGGGGSCLPSLFGTTAPRSFAFLTSVARSGLLAVPAERYIERRFVCRSASACGVANGPGAGGGAGAVVDRSLRDEGSGGASGEENGSDMGECECEVESEDAGEGGTRTGVEGVTPMRGGALLSRGAGGGVNASAPSALMSGPSLKTKVPPARRACSKSRSVREMRWWAFGPRSRELTAWRPEGKDDGGGGAADERDDVGLGRCGGARVADRPAPVDSKC